MSAVQETGLRFNEGKAELSMILEAIYALTGGARVLSFGARKYSRGNWLKGLSHTQIADSLLRHLCEWLAGNDIDPESELPHLDHVFINALFLAEMRVRRPDLDDRSIVPEPPHYNVPKSGPLSGIKLDEFVERIQEKNRQVFDQRYAPLWDLADRIQNGVQTNCGDGD